MNYLFLEFLAGGLSNALTSGVLNPLDVAKTRMQTQGRAPGAPAPSLLATLRAMRAAGGVTGLFLPGLAASAIREMLYSGVKAGLYVPLRDLFVSAGGGSDAAAKIAAALSTGLLGSILANPIDVVKIRLMRDPSAYRSTLRAVPELARAEGAAGLLRGLVPSALRGACVSAGEIATYDIAKGALRGSGAAPLGRDGVPLHVAASLVAGAAAAVVAAPWDLIKARAMSGTGEAGTLRGVLRGLALEGGLPGSLFVGVLPAYMRLGPHALIAFPVFEQLRHVFGLSYL
jgi:hypothetical protein